MKTAKRWQEELAGETSLEAIEAIQADARQSLQVKYAHVRGALVGLVGTEDRRALDAMEVYTRTTKGICEEDRANTLNAIHAVRDTIAEPSTAPSPGACAA